jgi:hypothetical protein
MDLAVLISVPFLYFHILCFGAHQRLLFQIFNFMHNMSDQKMFPTPPLYSHGIFCPLVPSLEGRLLSLQNLLIYFSPPPESPPATTATTALVRRCLMPEIIGGHRSLMAGR